MEILRDIKAINKAIGSIGTRGKKLDADIHVCAVSCLWYVGKHGQITPLNDLIKALPKGFRANAVKAWAETFGSVSYDTEAKAFKYNKAKETDLVKAEEITPWEFKPEPDYKPVNLPELLAKLVNRAENQAQNEDSRDHIPAELLAKLRELVPAEMPQA